MTPRTRRLALTCTVAAVVLASRSLSGSPGSVSIEKITWISSDAGRVPHVESFLAINPQNPLNMIATATIVDRGAARATVYATFDAGRAWQRARAARVTPLSTALFDGGDPTVYFDREGTAYFATIEGSLLVSRSTDGGLTWQEPVVVPGGTYDRPYLAFDDSGGAFDGRLYAGGAISVQELDGRRHFAIAVTYSTDGGRTFSTPRLLDAGGSGQVVAGIGDPLVARDGTLILPYQTVHRTAASAFGSSGQLWTTVSEDGGQSFLPARPGPVIGRGSGYRKRRTNTALRAAIDSSRGTPTSNRLYLGWVDFADDVYRIMVTASPDLGRTWSRPTVVPDSEGPNDAGNPALSVNRDGVLAVSFNDRRDDPAHECYRLYVAMSVDGARTFFPNVKAHDGATCPNVAGNWAPNVYSYMDRPLDLSAEKRRPTVVVAGIPYRWPNGGDTQGLAAAPDGRFHAAWINGESGVMQLWYTAFSTQTTTSASLDLGRRDVSRDLLLDVDGTTFDLGERRLRLVVRLRNITRVPIDGPFTVVVDEMQSALPGIRISNAANGLTKEGARWEFAHEGPLLPDRVTDAQELMWMFDAMPAEPGEPLRAHFVMLAGGYAR